MRLFIVGFMVLLMAFSHAEISYTQVTDEGESWPVAENCMAELRYPVVRQGNWNFGGVIVSQRYPEGTRGVRGDQQVDYFIALEADNSFPLTGTVSPNGVYFAYTTGYTNRDDDALGGVYQNQQHLVIIRTDGDTRERYSHAIEGWDFEGTVNQRALPSPVWIDDEWLYIYQQPAGTYQLIHFLNGETREWNINSAPELDWVSPDGTRGFNHPSTLRLRPSEPALRLIQSTPALVNLETGEVLQNIAPHQVGWFNDSSQILAWGHPSAGATLQLLDRDGNLLDTIGAYRGSGLSLSPDDRHFALWDHEQRLYIGDMQQRVLYDLCFQGLFSETPHLPYNNLAWSPDGTTLAFSYDSYLVLLEVETLQNRILNHIAGLVVNWSAMQGDSVTVADVQLPAPALVDAPTGQTPASEVVAPAVTPVAVTDDRMLEPISPVTIFHESVTVRTVQPEGERVTFAFDNDFRLFAWQGQVFRYPDSVNHIRRITPLDNNTLFIAEGAPIGSPQALTLETWSYDMTTGVLQPFQPLCPVMGNPLWYLSDRAWLLVVENTAAYLCNPFTGERSPQLPGNFYWQFDWLSSQTVTTSPNGRYVVVMGSVANPSGINRDDYEVLLYSYNAVTSEFINLGTFNAGQSFYFHRWFGTSVTLYTGDSRTASPLPMNVFIADATQPDSVQFAIGSYWSPRFMENPPRYIVGFEAPESGARCGSITFDVSSRRLTQLELDGLCRPEYGDARGVAYYRDVPTVPTFECCVPVAPEVAEVPLVRYDARTGSRRELYRGEIEEIVWVSSDERYAILMLDSNGRIDRIPYYDDFLNNPMQAPYHRLIDLQTGRGLGDALLDQFVFERTRGYRPWSSNFGIYPLSQRTFVVIDCDHPERTCPNLPGVASLITITDAGVERVELDPNPILLTPNRTGIFTWSQHIPYFSPRPDYQGINVYNLATRETRRLTLEFTPADYNFRLANVDERTAVLTVTPPDNLRQRWAETQYHIIFEANGNFSVEFRLPEQPAIGQFACVLTSTSGANLRVAPDAESERAGGVGLGQYLLAVDRVDGWWELSDGTFINNALVTQSPACANLPIEFVGGAITVQDDTLCNITATYVVNLRSEPSAASEWLGTVSADDGTLRGVGYAFNEADQLRWWQLSTGTWVREDFVEVNAACEDLPLVP